MWVVEKKQDIIWKSKQGRVYRNQAHPTVYTSKICYKLPIKEKEIG